MLLSFQVTFIKILWGQQIKELNCILNTHNILIFRDESNIFTFLLASFHFSSRLLHMLRFVFKMKLWLPLKANTSHALAIFSLHESDNAWLNKWHLSECRVVVFKSAFTVITPSMSVYNVSVCPAFRVKTWDAPKDRNTRSSDTDTESDTWARMYRCR